MNDDVGVADWSKPLGAAIDFAVDVVLRANGHADLEDDVVAQVALAFPKSRRPPARAYSFDMEPPDGSIGVSLWLTGEGVGDVVDQAIAVVVAAAHQVTGQHLPIWDIRIVP